MRIESRARCVAFLFLLLVISGVSRAAALQGDYVFSGKGAILLNFASGGAFAGVAAFPRFGVVDITGTLSGAGGNYELRDRVSGRLADSGSLAIASSSRGVRMTIGTGPGMSFAGAPRSAGAHVPAGLFAAPLTPVELLYQFVPSADPYIVTLQGDQDSFLDLNQALGGQFVFDQIGHGFGTVYENSDPAGTPHWAVIRFESGSLTLRVYTGLAYGKSRAIRLAAVNSGGDYDGIYTAIITPANCAAQTLTIKIQNDVVSASDPAAGTLDGFVDLNGHITFTSQYLTVSDGACQQSGAHASVVAFAGSLSNAAFPRVMEGTFIGAGTNGTFVLNQPVGATGATTTTAAPRLEVWTGTLTGTHASSICKGGSWNESYALSLTFPTDLIAALRGKNTILSGSGTMSGSETVAVQLPTSVGCSYLPSTLASTTVRVAFAGNLVLDGGVVDLQSDAVLLPSIVHFTNSTTPDTGENRTGFRLHVKKMSATTLAGEWPFGTFVLKKK